MAKMKAAKEEMKHKLEEKEKKMKEKADEMKEKAKGKMHVEKKKPVKKDDPSKGHTDQTDGINKKANDVDQAYDDIRIKLIIELEQDKPDLEILQKDMEASLSLADEFRKNLEEIELEEEKEFWTLYIDKHDEFNNKKKVELDAFKTEVAGRGAEWALQHKTDAMHADTHNRLANCISSLKETDKIAAETNEMLHDQVNMMNEWHGEMMDLNSHLDKIGEISSRMISREMGNSHLAKILFIVVILLVVYFICLMIGVLDPYLVSAEGQVPVDAAT